MRVLIARAGQHMLRNGRTLSTKAQSRVKIIGSDDAYTKITTVCVVGHSCECVCVYIESKGSGVTQLGGRCC